ncbi:pre-mRNA-processing ATP-dependent RNA helicase Prp5 [Hamiltosporidium tvaerminnensis]|uniref:RNA helicase n=1 Tax=Hamiltosporidium tvaerminnensis TaxID=1176355 RepID=A0A4Q9KSG0_9MICR|nr:pre-mRNA-processing ATP-dependent RNA helicase Prp5 [Hamiltosporidium tvaerminnensis]
MDPLDLFFKNLKKNISNKKDENNFHTEIEVSSEHEEIKLEKTDMKRNRNNIQAIIELKSLHDIDNYKTKNIISSAMYRKKNNISFLGSKNILPIFNFESLNIPFKFLDILNSKKIFRPTPIQSQVIPILLSCNNVVGVSETGTGKTLAYGIPVILFANTFKELSTIILTPTRELCIQIYENIKLFARPYNLNVCSFYGGTYLLNDLKKIKKNPNIVIATPGRLIDIMKTNKGKYFNVSNVKTLIIDEIDRMIDFGFLPQINQIISNIKNTDLKKAENLNNPNFRKDTNSVDCKNTNFKKFEDLHRSSFVVGAFSATTSYKVNSFMLKNFKNIFSVTVGKKYLSLPTTITHFIFILKKTDKFSKLLSFLNQNQIKEDSKNDESFLIFVNKKETSEDLSQKLNNLGYLTLSLNGNKDQNDRESIINNFRNKVCNILISTSLCSRGLDIDGLKNVINYDCPQTKEDFVHQVGRTGRFMEGKAYTFICEEERKFSVNIYEVLNQNDCIDIEEVNDLNNMECTNECGIVGRIENGIELGKVENLDKLEGKPNIKVYGFNNLRYFVEEYLDLIEKGEETIFKGYKGRGLNKLTSQLEGKKRVETRIMKNEICNENENFVFESKIETNNKVSMIKKIVNEMAVKVSETLPDTKDKYDDSKRIKK